MRDGGVKRPLKTGFVTHCSLYMEKPASVLCLVSLGLGIWNSLNVSVNARRALACKKKVELTCPCGLGPAVAKGKARTKRVSRGVRE